MPARMRRRKGFFYTIEAIFALLILLIGILVVLTARPKFVFLTQAVTYADGVQNILSTRTMGELGVPWNCHIDAPPLALEKCAERYTAYPDNTVLEQIAWYRFSGSRPQTDLANARDLADVVIKGIIAPTHYYNLTLQDEWGGSVVVADSVGSFVKPVEDATVRFVSRRISYFRNSTGVRGPIIATMEVWR